MGLINITNLQERVSWYAEITNLLNQFDEPLRKVAEADHWDFVRDAYKHPTREIQKDSLSGRTRFFIGLSLDQVWYKVDREADLAQVLTYTFSVVTSTRCGASDVATRRLVLAEHLSLAEITAAFPRLLDEALKFMRDFDEPPLQHS